MSSFLGHAGAGVAVYLSRPRPLNARSAVALGLLVLLAIAPDADYLAYWCCRINTEPRLTHSLVFCLGLAALVWMGGARRPALQPDFPGLGACAAAACSHLVLDLLVGVHPVPVLWPLPVAQWSAPVGLLPSAGHLSLTNYYFWRNLLIECAVLMPLYALLVAWMRGAPWRRIGLGVLLAAPLWAVFLVWSLRVHG